MSGIRIQGGVVTISPENVRVQRTPLKNSRRLVKNHLKTSVSISLLWLIAFVGAFFTPIYVQLWVKVLLVIVAASVLATIIYYKAMDVIGREYITTFSTGSIEQVECALFSRYRTSVFIIICDDDGEENRHTFLVSLASKNAEDKLMRVISMFMEQDIEITVSNRSDEIGGLTTEA